MRQTNYLTIKLCIIILSISVQVALGQINNNCLWYDQPAKTWKEALPVGNGRLGAMVFGDTRHETIQLNEESVWSGSKKNANNINAPKYLTEVRKALFAERFLEAESMAQNLVGSPPRIGPYQTLGEFYIDYKWKKDAEKYRRELNIQEGISTTEYSVDGASIRQTVFSSSPHNCLVIRISSSKKSLINAAFRLSRKKDAKSIARNNGVIEMTGQIIDLDSPRTGKGGAHMKFAAEARIKTKDGNVKAENDSIIVSSATIVEIRITGATDYSIGNLDFDRSIDPLLLCQRILDKTDKIPVSAILQSHINEHKTIFDRVSLDFGIDSMQKYPTDKRLQALKEGKTDNGLTALFFQYGRYLLMNSCRRPGVLPPNLQGIWNKDLNPLWESDFHLDINLQMNYWPAEVCNLSETSLILANFVNNLSVPGGITAKEMYGARGWIVHEVTDLFGYSAPNAGIWGLTPTCGAWLTFPLYEHYLFTGDREYLRKQVYPLMKGACDFFLDFLIPGPDGYLVTNPSNSCENKFIVPNADTTVRLTYMPTADIVIINGLFNNFYEAAGILGTDADYILKIKEIQKKLPPVKINSNGAVQEWIKDYKEDDPGHRHYSHLMGLFPLNQITPENKLMFDAAKKTVEIRTKNCDYRSGWHIAWSINNYARLLDGDAANEDIKVLLKSLWPNLFDVCSGVFQIDGNEGGTAGIAELLVQSQNGKVDILPALPHEWTEGHVRGLCARGGFEIEIEWMKGEMQKLSVLSKSGNTLRLTYKGRTIEMKTEKDKKYQFTSDLKTTI